MFKSLMPKEGKFFDLFDRCADEIVDGSQQFRAMLNEPAKIEYFAKSIKDIEHRADAYTHQTVELLHKTFITPLDRDQIHKLISQMDDIMDCLNAAAQRMHLYAITEVTPESIEMADTCIKAASLVRKAVAELSNLKKSQTILEYCVEINQVENEADHQLRTAMAKLFREEQDIRKLIKWKEIYEILETVTDRCEDVANTVESIVLEYA